MIGPDGKVYPIQIPQQTPPGTAERPAIGTPWGSLNNMYGDWSTVYSRQGNVQIG